MKVIIIIICFILINGYLVADKNVTIFINNGGNFSGRLLYGSDSLLYIWTGLSDFDQSKLNLVRALSYSQIKKIDVQHSISWKTGIKKVLPFTLGAGAAITIANFRDQSFGDALAFMGIFNLIFSVPAGGIVSSVSNFPKSIDNPSSKDFDFDIGKYKKYLLLKQRNTEIINKLILEVKP